MAKQLVFLVNGMGEHPSGWSDPAWELLEKNYASLANSDLHPWDATFERVEITYDGLFEKIRSQWAKDADAVLGKLRDGGLGETGIHKLMDLAESAGKDDFVTTHVLDVLMYRFIHQLHEQVKVHVGDQIARRLKDHPAGGAWSVIAHSLGTAVIHDTLHALAIEGRHGFTGTRPAKLLVTLANVSRALQTDVKAYESRVHTRNAGHDGITRQFFDIRHKWDPIAAFREFRPHDEWPDIASRRDGRFQEITLSAITEWNVHGFEHHLRDPSCFVPVFRGLTLDALISKDELMELKTRFLAEYPQQPRDAIRHRLEQLIPAPAGSDADLIRVLAAYLMEIQHA